MHLAHRVQSFCDWLQRTSLSVTFQETEWLVPAVQTVHILCVALVMFSSLILSLRLLGISVRDLSPVSVAQRFIPVIWWTLPVLLLTGAVLIVAEPARALLNLAFYLKLSFLLAASLLTLGYQLPLRRSHHFWSDSRLRVASSKLIALLSISLWVGVVLAGRWIAYVDNL